MEWFEALALLLGTIMFLMAVGMPIALAFLAANIIGAWVFMGGRARHHPTFKQRAWLAYKIRADADPLISTYGGNILPYWTWRPNVHGN